MTTTTAQATLSELVRLHGMKAVLAYLGDIALARSLAMEPRTFEAHGEANQWASLSSRLAFTAQHCCTEPGLMTAHG